jgi:hypothetical protein
MAGKSCGTISHRVARIAVEIVFTEDATPGTSARKRTARCGASGRGTQTAISPT